MTKQNEEIIKLLEKIDRKIEKALKNISNESANSALREGMNEALALAKPKKKLRPEKRKAQQFIDSLTKEKQ